MTDLGEATHTLHDNVTDLADVFTNAPWRRREFGPQELADLRAAALKLALLLSAIEVPVRRVVGR